MFKDSNVTVMVSDVNRAVRFYTETLGLTLKTRFGDEWAEVQAPGVTIGLHPARAHGPQPGRSESMSIGLQVDDLETAIATFKQKGVEFSPSHVVDTGFLRMAFFTDPDKTPLYLCAIKAG